MVFTKYTNEKEERTRINEGIRVNEVRVIGSDGGNLGVLKVQDAIAKAREEGLDLIEVSPNAVPPVCRIADFGKYQYDMNKKSKQVKSKATVIETKEAQVKIGTGQNDMRIKAEKIANWLKEGHRVKVDLFLWGRYKGMEFDFLKDRLGRFLAIIPESYKIADEIQRGPKGLTVTLERDRSGKKAAVSEALTPASSPAAAAGDEE